MKLPASFRDPSGFLFSRDHQLYRQVNPVYGDHYDLLMSSGLYDALVESKLLIPHREVDIPLEKDHSEFHRILAPERIPFISYPYEWCFSQLKEAALTTLEVQARALDFGMTLKDSSAYNIQFKEGSALLIDTLSFEKYLEGEPWVAYRQFCQHFLAPLLLMVYRDIRLSQLLRIHIDGVPLDLAKSLLPVTTLLRPSLWVHIHLHAKSQKYFSSKQVPTKRHVSRTALLGIVDNLQTIVKRLRWKGDSTEWADYYDATNYSSVALEEKKRLVGEFLDGIRPGMAWDLGTNTGLFARLAAERNHLTVCFDIDSWAVENHYRESVKRGETGILPLLLDLTNPSPGIGWGNQERTSLIERGPADTVLALALIHHLAISNNLPFAHISAFLGQICEHLIIEFVPKTDSQVKRLLSTREDIFPDYTQQGFERKFREIFTIEASAPIAESERVLYLMKKK